MSKPSKELSPQEIAKALSLTSRFLRALSKGFNKMADAVDEVAEEVLEEMMDRG